MLQSGRGKPCPKEPDMNATVHKFNSVDEILDEQLRLREQGYEEWFSKREHLKHVIAKGLFDLITSDLVDVDDIEMLWQHAHMKAETFVELTLEELHEIGC
jgi:hypothetical protein